MGTQREICRSDIAYRQIYGNHLNVYASKCVFEPNQLGKRQFDCFPSPKCRKSSFAKEETATAALSRLLSLNAAWRRQKEAICAAQMH
jgi:hypothetical protein